METCNLPCQAVILVVAGMLQGFRSSLEFVFKCIVPGLTPGGESHDVPTPNGHTVETSTTESRAFHGYRCSEAAWGLNQLSRRPDFIVAEAYLNVHGPRLPSKPIVDIRYGHNGHMFSQWEQY